MSKVILICGKICSGKSHYAKEIKEKENAVILSTDEMTYDLINNEQGGFYDLFSIRVNKYLQKKAVEIAKAGANVILDWGFWTKKERRDISAFLKTNDIPYQWHYIDVSDEKWAVQIEKRNAEITAGQSASDFYVNEGLMKKVLELFQEPERDEIDIWYVNE